MPHSLLTNAGMWVGKSAYLTADPMTIQEGRRAIAQAILDNRVKQEDQDVPKLTCQPNSLSSLILLGPPPPRDVFIHYSSDDD